MSNGMVRTLRFSAFGKPEEVLSLDSIPAAEAGAGQLKIKMQRAPVNPADFNLIEGTYGIRPELPCVAGNEGAGEVVAVGAGVQGFQIGDHVILAERCGTWRQELTLDASRVDRVPRELDWESAAQLRINPATAWRMMHDFVSLQPGDWIIQNAATSAVGRSVIQLAKRLGFHTLNLVRRESDVPVLQALGGDEFLVEGSELKGALKSAAARCKPKLGLNAVGGESATHLAKSLVFGGTMLTYGAMSRQPLTVPNGLFIFNDLRMCGFWITSWYQASTREARMEMLEKLATFAMAGDLKLPVERLYPLAAWKEALRHASQPNRSGKILLDLSA